MTEYQHDKLLNIDTKRDRNVKHGYSVYDHPYEPTPYSALEELVKNHEITAKDHIVDFGCGLGRLNFFFHYSFGASVTGVEKDEALYKKALQNLEDYRKKSKRDSSSIHFHCCNAEDYKIGVEENQFYFFHPFSIHIFRKVIQSIILSYEKKPRDLDVILYYSHDDYIFFLERETTFSFVKEVPLPDKYDRDSNERFVIYRLGK